MFRQAAYHYTLILVFLSMPLLLLLRLNLGVTTGHMDEYGYLFVGKTLMGGDSWPTHSYIFGWDLNWLLFAWGEKTFGGLTGARWVAASLGAASIIAMYAFVYALWKNHEIALIAALMLGFDGAHLYTSALATYDIISFTAFTCALPCVLLSCRPGKNQLLWTVLACSALCVSVLSKYIVIFYLPMIAALVLWYSPRQALIGMVFITSVLTAYFVSNFDQLMTLYNVQIRGVHGANANYSDILIRVLRQQWVILLLSVAALIFSVTSKQVELKKILILVTFSLPFFLYHLSSENVISLQKHLAFTSLFLIPMVSWCLREWYIQGGRSNLRGTILLSYIALFSIVNIGNFKTMQSSYPNVRDISTLSDHIPATGSVLSEDPYLFRYLLMETVPQEQIKETSWLDNNRDGIHEMRDVKQAIWGRKFDYVFLNDQQHPEYNSELRKMLSLRNYETTFEQNYVLKTMSGKTREGLISLYRKVDHAKQMNNSDHASSSLL